MKLYIDRTAFKVFTDTKTPINRPLPGEHGVYNFEKVWKLCFNGLIIPLEENVVPFIIQNMRKIYKWQMG